MTTFFRGTPDQDCYSMDDGTVHADNNVKLDDVITMSERDLMWSLRGRAIQNYALLEQSLCALMQGAGNMSTQVAVTIFYKITSISAVIGILEKLIHHKHSKKYYLFFNPFFKVLRSHANKRNEIVHWLAVINFKLDNEFILHTGVTLVPPSHDTIETPNIPHLKHSDLIEFGEKSLRLSRLLNMFNLTHQDGNASDASYDAWRTIFEEPFVYPLPEEHPLLAAPSL